MTFSLLLIVVLIELNNYTKNYSILCIFVITNKYENDLNNFM